MTDAGWFADPLVPGVLRWWDGTRWTDHVQEQAASQRLAPEPYLTYVGDRVVLPAWLVTNGASPDRCRLHGRSGATRRVTFRAEPPAWSLLFLLLGLLPGLILMLVVRKRLTAPDWTCCPDCRRTRRLGVLALVALTTAWPALVLWALEDPTVRVSSASGAVLFAVALVPLLLLLGVAHAVSQPRMVGGVLSPDGRTLSLPVAAFPPSGSVGLGDGGPGGAGSVLPSGDGAGPWTAARPASYSPQL